MNAPAEKQQFVMRQRTTGMGRELSLIEVVFFESGELLRKPWGRQRENVFRGPFSKGARPEPRPLLLPDFFLIRLIPFRNLSLALPQ